MKKFLLITAVLLVGSSVSAAQQGVTGVKAVATCGAQSLTAGIIYPATQNLTGTLCTTGSGGGGGAVTIADGADVTQGAKADSICGTATGNCTLVALTKFMTTAVTGSIPTGTNNIGGVTSSTNTTLTDCSGTIAAGGTAQNAFTANAGRHGFIIANIDTTEVMWVSFTTTAAASGTASYPLAPATATTFAGLNSFTSPMGMGINTALSVIAATTSHKFSCTVW